MSNIQPNRVFYLDGLRGWGAVIVMLQHVWVSGLPISPESSNLLRPFIFFNGNMAVALFFIVSGYALTISYFKLQQPAILRKILVGRYLRLIIPIGVVSTLFYIALHLNLVPEAAARPESFSKYIQRIPTVADFISFHFFYVLIDFDFQQAIILPLWTMKYEFLGSLALLLCLMVSHKISKKYFILFPALIISGMLHPFYGALFFGALCAYYKTCSIKINVRLIGLLACCLVLILSVRTYSFDPYYNTVCMGLLFVSVLALDSLGAFFSNSFSQFLGKISFPLYLVHAPIMWIVGLHNYGQVIPEIRNSAIIIIAFIVAWMLVPVERFAIACSKQIATSIIKS